jgi:histidinol dehydrogenase
MGRRLNQADADFDKAFDALVAAGRDVDENVDDAVAAIIADVRARGDAALVELTAKFDRLAVASVAELFVSPDEIEAARSQCDPDAIDALELAAERIDSYHRHQIPADFDYTDEAGVRLGARWTPLGAVGIYVPGGTASYPSSVLMNAIPARVAGVRNLTMTVPAPDGVLSPLVLAAASIAGIRDVIRIGGAQAVAALAWGTGSIAPVDKIVGPGNAYVAAAKRRVFGVVGIDMIAGPSEILVVADRDNDPSWIAADLLSQAEHDEHAQPVLICDDPDFADAVNLAVADHLSRLPRSAIARASWDNHGAIIVAGDVYETAPLIDRLAPEHLELALADPDRLAARVKNAGAIFLGRFAPEAIGDYMAGPSHVLPTSRSARFSSGLGVPDFLKRTSIIGCDAASLSVLGPAAETLARAEGLDAHALSVALRSGSNSGSNREP